MSTRIGFLLLTHAKPYQVLRLVRRLNTMFDHPPIVIHHDFNQCAAPRNEFPSNVVFVEPHLPTAWARHTVIEAVVRAMQTFIRLPNPADYFVLLSGVDYPIKAAKRIVADLETGDYDAHLSVNLIDRRNFVTGWHRKCFDRYCTIQLRVPSLTRQLRFKRRLMNVWVPLVARRRTPFSDRFRCYAGTQWLSATPEVAEYVVDYHARDPHGLMKHYRPIYFPEESYFQTVLANEPRFKLNGYDWRYADIGYGLHPTTLTTRDLPKLLASPAHFARKFDPSVDSDVLDELDRVSEDHCLREQSPASVKR